VPSLVVLAAGLGSRYGGGGDKQVAQVGAHGETILDYTAFDARRWGFGELVLVVRPGSEAAIAAAVGDRIARHLPVRYVAQEAVPDGVQVRRDKPWGTAHAVACALRELGWKPCGVVNADDWYGPEGMRALANQLARGDAEACLVAYPLGRTLSAHGAVNRAVCSADGRGRLTGISEVTGIVAGAGAGGAVAPGPGGTMRQLDPATPVSLNLWGFLPNAYRGFIARVTGDIAAHAQDATYECPLPGVVMAGINDQGWNVRMVGGGAEWCGLTHRSDRAGVQERFARAVAEGLYPARLWG
jgi:hypothetical protein